VLRRIGKFNAMIEWDREPPHSCKSLQLQFLSYFLVLLPKRTSCFVRGNTSTSESLHNLHHPQRVKVAAQKHDQQSGTAQHYDDADESAKRIKCVGIIARAERKHKLEHFGE
jgi:hypothetical protein